MWERIVLRIKSISDDFVAERETANPPLVSVITVVLNNPEALKSTIKSVLAQTYLSIEFVIVDGGSKDLTVNVIQKYSGRIKKWLSEPDRGIYDAMNKGVSMATGEWVIFMNAGDRFVDKEVVQRLFALPVNEADVVFGHHEVLYEDGFKRIQYAGEVCDLWKGMIFSHQAAFIRSNLLRQYPFNVANQIGADFEMLFDAYTDGTRFLKSNIVIAKVRNNGLSDIQRVRSLISHWRVVKKHQDSFRVRIFYILAVLDMLGRQFVKKVLPSRLVSRIIKLKYQ